MTESLPPELWPIVPRLLTDNCYLVLATASPAGMPWATPVFFRPGPAGELLWVSSPASRHSTNLASRPDVAITLFDSHAPIGGGEAIYAEATAARVDDRAVPGALAALNSGLRTTHHLTPADVSGAAPLRVYRADVSRWSVLVRGGDDRFDNVVDARLEVRPPGSA